MDEILSACFEKALFSNASDLFLTAGKHPAFRIRGKVLADSAIGAPSSEAIDSFRKMVAGGIGESLYANTGACDSSWSSPKGNRFRINFFHTAAGPSMAVRPVGCGNAIYAEELGLPPIVETLCRETRGLILLTGATGCGKSTTLAAMVNYINHTAHKHILTIESPIEFLHSDVKSLVSQRELLSDTFSCAESLRAALRENPDVIVIGEIRDQETMQAALNASLTGHLVIGTLHTADTVQALERVINMFPDENREHTAINLALAVKGILAQRLIPRADDSGMIPAMEVLLGTPLIRKLIAETDFQGLDDALKRERHAEMMTFTRAIFGLYKDGVIKLDDARKAVSVPEEFDLLVKGMETGVDSFRNQSGKEEDEEDATDMRSLLRSALKKGASDLILSAGTSPTVRLNGALIKFDLPPLTETDIQRMLYSLISRRQRVILEEQRELDFALSVSFDSNNSTNKESGRFRVNAFFQRGTLGIVARVVNQIIPDPEKLHLPPITVNLAEKQQGLILVTGPTGSGKSTTLASLLDHINQTKAAHIITIEDPIEYVHSNKRSIVEQRELHADTLSFSSALKYALRQNPDVIMVGEMRDVETMAAAITAAETGHLVLATIHTNSAPQTIDRIVDSFPVAHQSQIRVQLSAVLLGVVSQRLLPRLDGNGRIAAFEIMVGTPPVQALVRDGKSFQIQSVMETGAKDGMITMEKYMNFLADTNQVDPEIIKRFRVDYHQGNV